MPEAVFENQNLFPVGKGAQGSSIYFIGTSKLREASPEPVLPVSHMDASAIARAMAGGDKPFTDSSTPRNRHSIKGNKSNSVIQTRSLALERFLHSKPEDLLSFARRMFRNTSVVDSGNRKLFDWHLTLLRDVYIADGLSSALKEMAALRYIEADASRLGGRRSSTTSALALSTRAHSFTSTASPRTL